MVNVLIEFGLEVGKFLCVGRYIGEIERFLWLFKRMRGPVRCEDVVVRGVDLAFLVDGLLGNGDERVVFIGINHIQTIIPVLNAGFTLI